MPPKVTARHPGSRVPVMVTLVVPLVLPLLGLTLLTAGALAAV